MNQDIKVGDNVVIIAVKCCSKRQLHGYGTRFKVGRIDVFDEATGIVANGMGTFRCSCGANFIPDPLTYVWSDDGGITVPLECVVKLPEVENEVSHKKEAEV